MRSIIATFILLIISVCLLAGCHARKHTLQLMQNPHQLQKALQKCSQQKATTHYCQHVKLTHQVLNTFLQIAHQQTHQSWLKQTHTSSSQHQFKQTQTLQANSARIQQTFAKKIMQAQTHLAHLKTKKHNLYHKLNQNDHADSVSKKLHNVIKHIQRTQDKINIMYALVSLNMPTP